MNEMIIMQTSICFLAAVDSKVQKRIYSRQPKKKAFTPHNMGCQYCLLLGINIRIMLI